MWASKTATGVRAAALALLTAGVAATLPEPSRGEAAVNEPAMVAVIDVQRILTDSKAGKEVLARLKQIQESKLADLRAKQEEVTTLRSRLSEGRLSLSEERLAELEKQIEDSIIALRRFQDDADRELQKERDQAFAEIEKRVLPIIGQVGQEMGFTLIFNKFQSGLLFAQDRVDITDLILQRFDGGTAPAGG